MYTALALFFFFFMCDYGFISLLTSHYYIYKYSFFPQGQSFISATTVYLSSNRPHFLWVYRCDNSVTRSQSPQQLENDIYKIAEIVGSF